MPHMSQGLTGALSLQFMNPEQSVRGCRRTENTSLLDLKTELRFTKLKMVEYIAKFTFSDAM